MVWLDFLVFGIIIISCVISVVRGFIKEAVSLGSWALAFFLSISLSDNLALLLSSSISEPALRVAAAFAILFVSTLLVGSLASLILSTFIEKTGLTSMDKLLGAMFGLLRGVIIVCGLVILAGLTRIPQSDWWGDSLLVHYFVSLVEWLVQYVPDDLARYIVF